MVYSTRDFHSLGSSLLRKKVKNSPVLAMYRKGEKLHLRFCWKAMLPRNKLELCSPKINCPCELTLEPFDKLSDKSEVLVISSSYRPRPPLSSVDICDEIVSCSPSAHNIGVTFDQSLCTVPHVNAVCQSSFFHLRNIGFIRKYLTYDAAKIIIHAFVVSKLHFS